MTAKTWEDSQRADRERAEDIAAGRPVKLVTTGNLTGRPGGCVTTGELPPVRGWKASVETAAYVVISYRTPILWKDAAGDWIMPRVLYSPTTTQHQRHALHLVQLSGATVREVNAPLPLPPTWREASGYGGAITQGQRGKYGQRTGGF